MYITETSAKNKKAELKWIFRNIKSDWSDMENGLCHPSPFFCAEGDEDIQWSCSVYPNGYNPEDEGKISAYFSIVHLPQSRQPLIATVSFTFHDELGGKILTEHKGTRWIFTNEFKTSGWPEIAQLSDVTSLNAFSLTCSVEYGVNTTIRPESSLPISSGEPNHLVNYLQQLFLNRSRGDISFIINKKEIKAHKLILSRSPVFAAMFESGMKEALQNLVEIQDLGADIFEALLRFIYTDQVDLNKIDVQELLAAADKYLIPLLKFECQKFLSERLSTENCSEMLMLADFHNAVHLKRSTVKFIRLHSADVMETEGWKEVEEWQPELACNVLKSILDSSKTGFLCSSLMLQDVSSSTWDSWLLIRSLKKIVAKVTKLKTVFSFSFFGSE